MPTVRDEVTGELVEVRPVEAAAAIVISSSVGGEQAARRRDRVEAAMVRAVQEASAAGITDPIAIRERMLAARAAAMEG